MDIARPPSDKITLRLLGAGAAAVVFSGLVVVSALGDTTPLGAPRFWSWLLTALQVIALWMAGRGRDWGWLLGGSVQVPWIAYAVMTAQLGFIPGCVVSATVQTHSFLRRGESHIPPVVERTAGAIEEHSR